MSKKVRVAVNGYGVIGKRVADAVRLQRGHRILAVNRRPVRSAADFEAALRDLSALVVVSLRVVDPDIGQTILDYEPEPLHRGG